MSTRTYKFEAGRGAPMTNAERQRRFREEHPGYYQALHAKRRAEVKALIAERALAEVRAAALALPVRLALPAPVEAILIPGMTTIPAKTAATPDLLQTIDRG
jgi:hypothetical protein